MMKSLITLSVLGLPLAAQAACPRGTTSLGRLEGKELCGLKGKYVGTELILTANNRYLLEEGVFIGGDNTGRSVLRLQPGTVVHGNPGTFISIMRGSQIFAEGTKTAPVVFTSLKLNQRRRGEWGGIVINGNAKINACNNSAPVCEAVSEGIKVEPVKFGGNNDNDNSGVLRYVRVEFAGYPVSQDNELNGITFNAVGAGTTVDNVQVNMNADDGVEFFGGTVNVKHLVLTNNEDDSLDWDMGFRGKIQYLLVQQANDAADNGIEADNLASPMGAEPRSNPTISNATFLGGTNSAYGLLLRRGTGASFHNTVVSGFKRACIDIDDAETFRNGAQVRGATVEAQGLKFENGFLNCAKNFEAESGDAWSTETWARGQDVQLRDPVLTGWFPANNSPLLRAGVTPDDLFFDTVDYIGAFANAQDGWAQGWTSSVME